jgi:hypothetical protein
MTTETVSATGRLIRALVPERLAHDPAVLRQARRVVAFVLAMLIWVPVYTTIFGLLNAPISQYVVLWAGAAFASTTLLIRSGVSPTICGHFFVAAVWTAYAGLALLNGGALGPSNMWFASIPLMSLWLLGTRGGLFWTLLSLATITYFGCAQWSGLAMGMALG